MPDIDLTKGRPESSGGGGRPGGSGPRPGVAGEAARARIERELKDQLEGVFGRLSDACEARHDEELATILAEDKAIMANGLVSLTETVKPLRGPLVFGLNLLEPILAFGRLFRVLIGRFFGPREEELAPDGQST